MNLPSWTDALQGVSQRLTEMAPALLGAVGIMLAGWLAAIVLRLSARKGIVAILERLDSRSRLGHGVSRTRLKQDAPRIIAEFLYWVVLLFFAAAAVDNLPLPVVTDLLQSIAYYLPKVLLAVVIAFIGLGAGSQANLWITSAAEAAGAQYAAALGRVAQIGVVVVALTIGAQQIGLQSELFTLTLSIVIGSTLGGMALAFALGSGSVVSSIMGSYYAAKAYRVGDFVRLGGVEGTVREINPTSIVLDSDEGQLHVPARKYCDEISLVRRGQR